MQNEITEFPHLSWKITFCDKCLFFGSNASIGEKTEKKNAEQEVTKVSTVL